MTGVAGPWAQRSGYCMIQTLTGGSRSDFTFICSSLSHLSNGQKSKDLKLSFLKYLIFFISPLPWPRTEGPFEKSALDLEFTHSLVKKC